MKPRVEPHGRYNRPVKVNKLAERAIKGTGNTAVPTPKVPRLKSMKIKVQGNA